MKRYKRSSLIPKKAKYILAKQFHLSPNTFSKLLSECIVAGHIVEEEKVYRIISFRSIVKEVFEGTGIYFGKHGVLKERTTDYKSILDLFQQLLVVDNVIKRQQREIDKKYLEKLFWDQSEGTDKKSTAEWFKLSRSVRARISRKCIKKSVQRNDQNDNKQVITSARNTALKIGVSSARANKTLNKKDMYFRDDQVMWVNGLSPELFDYTRNLYRKAVVIPVRSRNQIKVCFGSMLTLVCM